MDLKNHLKKLLQIDLQKSIQILLSSLDSNSSDYNIAIAISAKFNNLSHDIATGIIDYDAITIERAKITKSILYLIDKIDNNNSGEEIKIVPTLIDTPEHFETNDFIQSTIKEIEEKIKSLRFEFAKTTNNFAIRKEMQVLEQAKRDLKNEIRRKKIKR